MWLTSHDDESRAKDQPGLKGMLTTYRDGRWLLMFTDDQERDENTLRQRVLQAVGKPDLEFELLTTGRWVPSALIADRFSSGLEVLTHDAMEHRSLRRAARVAS